MNRNVLYTLFSNKLGEFSEATNLIGALNAEVDKSVLESQATVKDTLVYERIDVCTTQNAHHPKESICLISVGTTAGRG